MNYFLRRHPCLRNVFLAFSGQFRSFRTTVAFFFCNPIIQRSFYRILEFPPIHSYIDLSLLQNMSSHHMNVVFACTTSVTIQRCIIVIIHFPDFFTIFLEVKIPRPNCYFQLYACVHPCIPSTASLYPAFDILADLPYSKLLLPVLTPLTETTPSIFSLNPAYVLTPERFFLQVFQFSHTSSTAVTHSLKWSPSAGGEVTHICHMILFVALDCVVLLSSALSECMHTSSDCFRL